MGAALAHRRSKTTTNYRFETLFGADILRQYVTVDKTWIQAVQRGQNLKYSFQGYVILHLRSVSKET